MKKSIGIGKRIIKRSVLLAATMAITIGSVSIVSAKSYFWIFSGTKTITGDTSLESDTATIPSGVQEARLHSNSCTTGGHIHIARYTKGWIFYSKVTSDMAYFNGTNQYRYYDLGEETSSKSTYYEVYGENPINARIDDSFVVIDPDLL